MKRYRADRVKRKYVVMMWYGQATVRMAANLILPWSTHFALLVMKVYLTWFAVASSDCLSISPSSTDPLQGNFLYGHVHWTRTFANTVDFVIIIAVKRSISVLSYQNAKTGDAIYLQGKEPPEFLFGDSTVAQNLKMVVTNVSYVGDWIQGEVRLSHTYATPTNGGKSWDAQLVGCCRTGAVLNNADLAYAVRTEVNLIQVWRSVRAITLPFVTVTCDFSRSQPSNCSSFALPVASGENGEWEVMPPYYVGNAAQFEASEHSKLSVTGISAGNAVCNSQDSSGKACLVDVLTADLQNSAVSIEGWVMITQESGGYVFSSSMASTGRATM
eukprot:766376-Hanusia_phi.AAC.3